MRRCPKTWKENMNKSRMCTVVLLGIILFLMVSGMGTTLAYLSRKSGVDNTFVMGDVQTEITENFENNVKTNVAVRNKGNVPVYIRAAVLVYWQDAHNNVLPDKPAEKTDYTITLNQDNGWIKGSDGYYYYPQIVNAGESTRALIDRCEQTTASAEKTLVVDIAAQSIQANPPAAVTEAWTSVTVTNGQLALKGAGQ